jgi:hypothetical protein
MAQFYSSMSLSALARQGDPAKVRQSLTRQLEKLGIDPTPAIRGLPDEAQADDDVEIVARLVSLARGHGYGVELSAGGKGSPEISIVRPSSIGTLQSGHHIAPNARK